MLVFSLVRRGNESDRKYAVLEMTHSEIGTTAVLSRRTSNIVAITPSLKDSPVIMSHRNRALFLGQHDDQVRITYIYMLMEPSLAMLHARVTVCFVMGRFNGEEYGMLQFNGALSE
eukprot:scaffold1413_cov117-Cylindrotheca_fusiformis.AAC.13